MSFGLLDKVNSFTRSNVTPTPTPVNPTPIKHQDEFDGGPLKTLTSFDTLEYGDLVLDNKGNVRYVVAVDKVANKLMLTGKKSNLNNYKKVFTWTRDKILIAIREQGFHMAY